MSPPRMRSSSGSRASCLSPRARPHRSRWRFSPICVESLVCRRRTSCPSEAPLSSPVSFLPITRRRASEFRWTATGSARTSAARTAVGSISAASTSLAWTAATGVGMSAGTRSSASSPWGWSSVHRNLGAKRRWVSWSLGSPVFYPCAVFRARVFFYFFM